MSFPSYNENMTSKRPVKKVVRPIPVDALEGEQPITFQRSQCSVNERREVTNRVGAMLDGKEEGGQETGGRSESFSSAAKVTAKPLPLLSKPTLSLSSDHNGDEMVNPPPNPDVVPAQDMPVLGVPMGVHQKEGGKVVQTYHQGGLHSKTSPILGHNESSVEVTSIEVPYSPDVEAPNSTEDVMVTSPFITHNDRIDRRTAFSKYCQLGEGRTYMKVANIMGVSLDTIKDWAREDLWENAYRERITADVIQEAREENIHEALDMKREMIALLKAKLVAAKKGEDVFKSPKEMLDVLRQVEELTGSANLQGRVQPNQIYIVISPEEYEARMKSNEQLRKEEAKA